MELTQKQASGAEIVGIHGKLVGTPQNCDTIHAVIRSLLDNGTKKIVVDLTDTTWANSQGIGMLIGAHTSVVKAGGKLVLAGPNDRISSVLAVTRLDLVFKSFPNEDAAVRYLTASPRIDPDTRSQAIT